LLYTLNIATRYFFIKKPKNTKIRLKTNLPKTLLNADPPVTDNACGTIGFGEAMDFVLPVQSDVNIFGI